MLVAFWCLVLIIACLFYHLQAGALLALIPLGLAAALFCTLTIQITRESLKWSFGPGLISRQVALKEIAAAEPVENSWLARWVTHYTRREWVYNVAGADAVRVTLKNGKSFRLGTDEPEALTAEIRSKITQ